MSSGTLSIILTVLGVACVILAFAADVVRCRFRRRRRCPKCWYDMSHSPGLTCSECGFAASSEKRLLRFRRRWRYALLAPLLFAGAWTSHRWPQIEARGWPAAIPTTALVSSVWYVNHPNVWYTYWSVACCNTSNGNSTDPSIPLREFIAATCAHELVHRISDETPADWQCRLLSERLLENLESLDPFIGTESGWEGRYTLAALLTYGCLDRTQSDEQRERSYRLWPVWIRCRPTWPADVKVYAEVEPWRPFVADDIHLRFSGTFPAEQLDLVLDRDYELSQYAQSGHLGPLPWSDHLSCVAHESGVGDRLIHTVQITRSIEGSDTETTLSSGSWSRQLEWPIEFVPSIDDVLTPVRSVALDEAIRESFRAGLANSARFGRNGPPELLVYPEFLRNALVKHGSPSFAATFTVAAYGVDVATGSAWWNAATPGNAGGPFSSARGGLSTIQLTYATGVDPDELFNCELTLRITSNPELALRCFDADRYWQGEVEIPLRVLMYWHDDSELTRWRSEQK